MNNGMPPLASMNLKFKISLVGCVAGWIHFAVATAVVELDASAFARKVGGLYSGHCGRLLSILRRDSNGFIPGGFREKHF